MALSPASTARTCGASRAAAHDFPRTVDAAVAEGPCRFVDLGPSGTLATFIKHQLDGHVSQAPTINQFGRNLQSLSRLLAELATEPA